MSHDNQTQLSKISTRHIPFPPIDDLNGCNCECGHHAATHHDTHGCMAMQEDHSSPLWATICNCQSLRLAGAVENK